MTTCPQCKGSGQSYCHLNYGERGGEWKWLPCTLCCGDKEISEEQFGWLSKGKALRAARLSRNLILRDAAKLLGMNAVDLSKIEQGKASPDGVSYP